VAEWARLLSECRGNSVAGSNPALPAIGKTHSIVLSGVFCFRSRVPIQGMIFESRPPRHKIKRVPQGARFIFQWYSLL
jgi:hypothetical protein